MTARFPDHLARALLPGYVVQGPLGEGAAGWVVRALDQSLGREVAIKVARRKGTPQQLARFEREGRIAGGLQHPQVVRTHTLGNVEGHPFLVLELVPGARTLRMTFQEEPVPARLSALRDVVEAMAYAHTQGVVHRDLKPENVLVDRMGRGRVTDFGVATMRGLERMTQSGALVGTPHYMAPEQLGGKRGDVGPHTDVWALGVMLYEAVNGKRPFGGDTLFELASQVSRGTPPSSLQPGTPPAILGVLKRALSPHPKGRFPHAGSMLRALDAALEGKQVRNWKPVGIAAAFGVLALLAALGALWVAGRSTPDPDPGGEPSTRDPRGTAEWERICATTRGSERLAAGERWLEEFSTSKLEPQVDKELAALRLEAPRWVHREHETSVRVFSSRSRLTAVDDKGGVSIAPWAEVTRVRHLLESQAGLLPATSNLREEVWVGAAYRGQGSLLRIEGEDQPQGIDEAGRSLVQKPTSLTLSPNGELLALAHGLRTSIYRAEAVLEGGFGFNQLGWLKQPTVPVAQVIFADGSAISSVTGEGTLERLDTMSVLSLESYEIVGTADLPVVPTCMIELPGNQLALGSRSGHLLLFDDRAVFLNVLKDPELPPRAGGVSASMADVYDGRANDGTIYGIALSPTGLLYVVGADGTDERSVIRVWDLERKTLLRTQRVPRPYRACCLSADGRYLACGSEDGAIEVWDRRVEREWSP